MIVRAFAELGVGDHWEVRAATLMAQLDALVDEGEPIVSVHCPIQDGTWLVDVLFTQTPPDAQARWLAAARDIAPEIPPFQTDPLADRDWVAESQKALHPVSAGTFIIHGSHDTYRLPPSRRNVEIDAGRAFGTAHHASTRGCIVALEQLARKAPLGSVHDVGTGTGVLLLVADRLGAGPLSGGDIDPDAVRVAKANAGANRSSRLIHIRVANGPFAQADTVIANILARPLIAMAPAVARATGERLVLSGLRTRDVRRVTAAYRARGLVKAGQITIEDWATLMFKRPRLCRLRGRDSL